MTLEQQKRHKGNPQTSTQRRIQDLYPITEQIVLFYSEIPLAKELETEIRQDHEGEEE